MATCWYCTGNHSTIIIINNNKSYDKVKRTRCGDISCDTFMMTESPASSFKAATAGAGLVNTLFHFFIRPQTALTCLQSFSIQISRSSSKYLSFKIFTSEMTHLLYTYKNSALLSAVVIIFIINWYMDSFLIHQISA